MLTRREFLNLSALAGMGLLLPRRALPLKQTDGTTVALVKAEKRAEGIRRAVDLLGGNPVQRKKVVLKPNFNSAHDFPGSTHPDTLRALVEKLSDMGATQFTVADRSGMGDTARVMQDKGVFDLGKEMNFQSVVLDDLPLDAWKHFEMKDAHWQKGVYFPKLFLEAESLVQTCCLKTHRFGGHFTLSLKNSVGMVAKFSPKDNYNFMGELHGSRDQRRMIAEINQLYQPDLVVLDGMEGFVDAGPEAGKRVQPGVIIAGTDRVAVDAVGVAILRLYGTTPVVSAGAIFEQEQIQRAAEIGVGVDSPEKITVVVPDEESGAFAKKLVPILGMKVQTMSVRPTGKLPLSWGEMKRA